MKAGDSPAWSATQRAQNGIQNAKAAAPLQEDSIKASSTEEPRYRCARAGFGWIPRAALTLALGALPTAPIGAQETGREAGETEASFCSDGVITSIALDRRTAFDPDSTDVSVLKWTYRAMNALHVTTQPSFIRRELLFTEGDCYDPFLVAESQRLLDDYQFMALARITSEADGEGGRSLLVHTQDEWSTQVDVGLTYDEGLNLETFEVTEENFLGQGVYAELTHRERLEVRSQAFRLSTPRFFGRTDASVEIGRDRPGGFFNQYLRYPFIGETGRTSLRQGYGRGWGFFAYGVPDDAPYTQVVLPTFRESVEMSAARRLGQLGRSVIVGATLSRDVTRYRTPEAVYDGNFDDLQPLPEGMPPRLGRQLGEMSSTRLWLHVGAPRYRYVDYIGLDGVRDRLLVGLGYSMGASVGKGFDVLTPADVPGVADVFARVNGTFTLPIGSSLVHARMQAESRHFEGTWRDLLTDGELVAYLRNDALSAHTGFIRASFVGGWRTTIPFQLSLGGREGVRSLAEDRFPGGRMARFVVEDRVAFPWPRRSVDLGMTLFADIGRMWPGDAPYGVDSDWQTAVGAGLRIGLPARTGRVWRTDIAFPVGGASGSPVFRVTFEFNRLRWDFFTRDMIRSQRFGLGADDF